MWPEINNLLFPQQPAVGQWQDNGIGGYTRTNNILRQTEYMPNANYRNRIMSSIPTPEEVVIPGFGTKNTPSTPQSPTLDLKDKLNQYDTNDKYLEGTGHILQGTSSLVNAGVGIWNAIEQAKLNKEQMANMAMQRKVWEEQIASSREARTQRKQELARLNKIRSNTKAQFNTRATVTRSY